MPTTRDQIRAILQSPEFTEGEKWVVRMQYRREIPAGNFEGKLWELMCAADDKNLRRLMIAFPQEAVAFDAWVHQGLGERIRRAGLDI